MGILKSIFVGLGSVVIGALALSRADIPIIASEASAAAGASASPTSSVEGPRLISQDFGNWTYRCSQEKAEGRVMPPVCELFQQVAIQQDGKAFPVLSIAISHSVDGIGHDITLWTPLGVRTKPGMGLGVDNSAQDILDYEFCGPRGCLTTKASVEPHISAMKSGNTGWAKLVLANGESVALEFSLMGFSAGLAALDATSARQPINKVKAK